MERKQDTGDQKNITSKSGQSVTLPCRAPNKDIRNIVLEWSRADLGDEYVLTYETSNHKNITSKSGQNVTLPCRAPNKDIRIIVLEWSRADLGEEYVLVYRDEQFDPDYQHPSFVNRVDLQDKQMKDGDVSLILKDVTINDAGTYECRVAQRQTREETANLKLVCNISLSVDPPDQKNITSKSGQSVTLPCRAPNKDIHIIVLEWSRADLGEEYVLVYRDEQFDPDYQHPSFKDRLDLQDRQMKDGDVSLILKDVTINDTGTYECRVFSGETRSWESINTIKSLAEDRAEFPDISSMPMNSDSSRDYPPAFSHEPGSSGTK
ncbi:matrix remodeling-associated protein 8-like [Neolamprologus brichardi]|uniref:matrix remodeling-associated protein 8-like n=1 Tax=Neolamprologus brichardi TaxID=32507 RepID=UPI001643A8D6|nr:matrix remodeling-associated protein 8-like [Neolamprologus brichardi]